MDETFAEYFLDEKDWENKLNIMYYLKKRTGVFFDSSVVFKTLITKLFLDYLKVYNKNIEVDENTVISARLLCDIKKVKNSTDLDDIKNYAKESAKYLENVGFSKEFCKICEGVNRYTYDKDRKIESDILEMSDQFGGMCLNRPERIGMESDEALTLIKYRNLKGKVNKVMKPFTEFINYLEKFSLDKIMIDNFNDTDSLTESIGIAKNWYDEIISRTKEFTEEPKTNPLDYKNKAKTIDVNQLKADIENNKRKKAYTNIDIKNNVFEIDEQNPYLNANDNGKNK